MKLASLGRLTANIAHEIRNPLSAISHANQLLQEEEGLTSGPQRLLQIIDDNVQRMDHMVQDVLQLNRRDRANQETIALPGFLEEFRQQISEVEKIPPGALVLETGAIEASCRFDRRHLQQILWNLCCNGWRHSSRQPGSLRLRLSLKGKRNNLKIEVIDDGPGVAPELRPHLFEPFFTTESNGTGLGLYIARDLCEANGASIEYADTIEGTCFSIFIKPHHG
jgi:two-component system sensor histidine kinase PilS (NtrC family)